MPNPSQPLETADMFGGESTACCVCGGFAFPSAKDVLPLWLEVKTEAGLPVFEPHGRATACLACIDGIENPCVVQKIDGAGNSEYRVA